MQISGENSDAIHIQELELSVRLGVPDEERAQPQRLTVSITLWPEARFDELHDQLAKTVNYAAICRDVDNLATHRTDKLIETLAAAIALHLLAAYPIERVRIELRKFILPEVKYVAVILTRSRT
ncbi:MAG TPA: dihydroneopterin aldolase [Chthoniobacterales bacterium]|nr:dihydroneopterin aldolase [Chthoniobacterales bacterium]